MSDQRFSRRAVSIGGGIAVALGITALGITVPRLLARHYRQSAYDDLFAQLVDREATVRVGRSILARWPSFSAKAVGRDLRQRLERRTLREVTDSDLAQSSLTEVEGWVLPSTLALLCALAAEES